MRPAARNRSHASNVDTVIDAVGSSSAADQCVAEDVRTARSKCGHVTSMTSSTGDRDLDLGRCETAQSACEAKDNEFSSDNELTAQSCGRQQGLEKSEINNITTDTSDGSLQQSSVSNTDIGETIGLHSDTGNTQHSHARAVTPSVSQDIDSREILAETRALTQDEKSADNFKETNNTNDNSSITQVRLRCSDVRTYREQDRAKETDKKTLSPFDELEIERDFEYMDEILSCLTPELYRFVKSPDTHFSDDPSTRSFSTPVSRQPNTSGQESPSTKTLVPHDDLRQWYCAAEITGDSSTEVNGPKSCPFSTTEVGPVRGVASELLYTVHSVISAPVIEVARSLSHAYCLSSPQLSDYVAESCHKVNEVSDNHHQHHHEAGPGRRREDLADCSPCSDEIALGSPDTSTKCSPSSPSGSQLSQDSCRWRSPDDSTLVGDLELCSTSCASSRSTPSTGLPRPEVVLGARRRSGVVFHQLASSRGTLSTGLPRPAVVLHGSSSEIWSCAPPAGQFPRQALNRTTTSRSRTGSSSEIWNSKTFQRAASR